MDEDQLKRIQENMLEVSNLLAGIGNLCVGCGLIIVAMVLFSFVGCIGCAVVSPY